MITAWIGGLSIGLKHEMASLGIMYLSDSNEKLINMRDNWSRELSLVPERAKETLKSLVSNWLYKK